ncbi:MAG: alkaline phosphatase family protein [Promethearchaeota archaeon]
MTHISKINQIILILLDDVRSSHLFGLIEGGKLPTMKKIMDNGIFSKNCITSFYSVTFPCYPNIITGVYSGYFPKEGSGIPAYHWVNRTDSPQHDDKFPFIRNYNERKGIMNIGNDLGSTVKTIFEQDKKEGNHLSALNIVSRGSHFAVPPQFNTEGVFKTIQEGFENPKKFFDTNEAPRITVGYVPATDSLMHEKGFDHEDYINEIIKCDEYLKKLINYLEMAGYLDSTAICIASDHGNYKAKKMFDLEPYFNQIGLVQYNPKRGTGDFDCAIGSVGTFNFKGNTWHDHPTIDQLKHFQVTGSKNKAINILEILWNIPGVKYMYYRDDNNTPDKGIIHLKYKDIKTNKIHHGMIEYRGHGRNQTTKYVYESEELFGYSQNESASKLLDGKFHDIDEWLAATNQIDFPMIIDQLPRTFKNPRSCDIMISTCGEYCFSYEHGKTMEPHVYSHDIALKQSMTVPLLIGGSPNIPDLHIKYCKTTDIVPTLLHLLGEKPHQSVVGKSLI